MTTTDIAKRVYDHTWKLDPIIRSLLDTDFYKLLMLQMIWGLYPDVQVTFSLFNRSSRVRIADEIDETRAARPARPCAHHRLHQEGDDLARRQHLLRARADLRARVPRLAQGFPAARIRAAAREDGQYILDFVGPWTHTTMWEIPALAIINELRSRAALRDYGRFDARRHLRARQGQAVVEGRAARAPAGAAHLRFRHAPAAQLPVAPLVRGGAQGGPRRAPSSARATCCSRWTTTSRRSAPTRTSFRWCSARSRETTRSCARRPIGCCRTGRRYTAATC